ncbi:OmpA family protein [Aeromonas cavernicola]|uniref:OmpA-like domain-containing protein n=1 Tax=Aeromonas cavernicola TaxID=1006623 RepID=A0A2H9U124_9GAMM|nr:OmpA family protein [Aeromonas cavernicola]PJG57658.1 hypothetical protein CUC53_16855 [Aeromonas cavernicola]
MNNNITSVRLAVALVVALPTTALADDWYGGIGAGVAIGHDLAALSQAVDKNQTALALFGGYTLNQYIGAELGYLSTGDWQINGSDFKSQGVTLSAIGRLPINQTWTLFSEGGGYLYHVSSGNGGDDNLAPLVGLGVTATLSDWVDIQARYRYVVRVGDDPDNDRIDSGTQRWVSDISTATLELVIHPNRRPPADPEPAPVIAPPVAEPPQVEERTFNLSSDVLFAFGEADLKPEGMTALTSLYQQISEIQPKEGSAVVMGYTDRIGSEASNQQLSEARAKAVANFLMEQGLPAGSITIEGHGSSEPVSGEECDAMQERAQLINCLAADRRVEVKVTGSHAVSPPEASTEPEPAAAVSD